MTDLKPTRSQKAATEIAALLRARNCLLWINTREEARAERYIFEAAAAAKYVTRTWDCGDGVCDVGGKQINNMGGVDLDSTLSTIKARSEQSGERCVWVLRDAVPWITGAIGLQTGRRLRNLARSLPLSAPVSTQAIVILAASGVVPDELAGHATVIDWPLPDREEIASLLRSALTPYEGDARIEKPANGAFDAAVDAAVGLLGTEAENTFAKSLVELRRIDPALIAREKKAVIARDKVLEWIDPLKGGVDAVGGLENLKQWLAMRKTAYSSKARAYGLPAPKGVLLVGIPGCGKSMTAKAVATAWGVPLLKLDPGALKSKFVGESEANLRKAFKTIEAVGRCVVWLDEIEKALQGATSGSSDGGVSADTLGALLSWMQDRTSEAFIIATSNDVSSLPPELLRKGRFDDIFFVDMPTREERVAVLQSALWAHGRPAADIDRAKIVAATDGFTGAEIASLVPDALFTAFAEDAREITTEDLIAAAQTVVPLGKTAADKIGSLRKWAIEEGRARLATKAEDRASPKLRALDI